MVLLPDLFGTMITLPIVCSVTGIISCCMLYRTLFGSDWIFNYTMPYLQQIIQYFPSFPLMSFLLWSLFFFDFILFSCFQHDDPNFRKIVHICTPTPALHEWNVRPIRQRLLALIRLLKLRPNFGVAALSLRGALDKRFCLSASSIRI